MEEDKLNTKFIIETDTNKIKKEEVILLEQYTISSARWKKRTELESWGSLGMIP
jgi:hypothetical protein